MKNQNKTVATTRSVDEYIASVPVSSQAEARSLVELMSEVTGEPAVMWGPAIVGFGSYHYKSAAGREGDFLRVGFSMRKAAISLYLMTIMYQFDTNPRVQKLLKSFGKYTAGKGCIYVKHLEDIDKSVLKQLVKISYDETTSTAS